VNHREIDSGKTGTSRSSAGNSKSSDTLFRPIQCYALKSFLLIGLVAGSDAVADSQTKVLDDRFGRTVYAGAGIGFSALEPNTNKINGWDLDENTSTTGQIQLGIDLSRQLSVEWHAASLGSAGLSPSGRIKYDVNALSALFYAGGNRDRFKRSGVTAFGRGGFGVLRNSAVGEVPFRTVDANHWLWGAGVEYMNPNGFGARAELISVAEDVQYGQLGMIYRFGRPQYLEAGVQSEAKAAEKTSTRNTERKEPPLPPPPPPPPILESPQAADPVIGNDAGVADGSIVADECRAIEGEIDGIRFDTGAALLTPDARSVLDSVAATLAKCPELPLIVSAHTDSRGTERTNFILSHRRAWAVINYLRSVGVNLLRMTPRAFGETRPVDSNDTETGRRNNRRVELIADNPAESVPNM
jgi:outer membrane protein OmpA-like peptidoglycan-associated protein